MKGAAEKQKTEVQALCRLNQLVSRKRQSLCTRISFCQSACCIYIMKVSNCVVPNKAAAQFLF